jgi:hypothetical protein
MLSALKKAFEFVSDLGVVLDHPLSKRLGVGVCVEGNEPARFNFEHAR